MAKKRSKVKTLETLYGNYASFVTEKFETHEIRPGDRIRVKEGPKDLEGNLLSQTELGDQDTIIVKLDSGYNVGIRVTPEFTIEKLEGAVDLEKYQVRLPEQTENLPEISLLATGGTIASRIDYKTGGVVMAMEPEEIFASLPELFNEVSFHEVKSLFTLGSEDMHYKQWQVMAKEAAYQINDGVQGVVFTHGTDTMGYSSAALSFMLSNLPVPVVLTGAQRSSDRGSYDGAMNLIAATRIAARADIASVMICMHESSEDTYCQLSRGTKVRKMHTSRRDAFKTINEGPLARISHDGNIEELMDTLPRRHPGNVELLDKYEPKVALLKMYPGIDPAVLDWYVDQGYRGIILEGTGLGHFPTFPPKDENRSWTPSVERAISEGVFVGMTSQCLYGRVHPFVYRALRTGYQIGVTFLEDMLPETAMVKLGWALANHPDDVKKTMMTNFAGEISPQSNFTEYV